MKLHLEDLDKRIAEERQTFIRKATFHQLASDVASMIKELDPPIEELNFRTNTWFMEQLTIYCDNTPVETAIEYILGPIHRRFNLFWKLEIEGDEEEPTFRFTAKNYEPDIQVRIKEGAFKQCSIKRRAVGYTRLIEPSTIYKYEMVCE